MNRLPVCYPQPGKAKSRVILEAFAAGCGGRVSNRYELEPGPAAFYGVVGIEPLWHSARERGDYLYLDNSFFDASRGTHYRAARNALQDWKGEPDWHRFKALELNVEPWKRTGRHIVVVMQSEHFMRDVAGWPGGALAWQEHVLRTLKRYMDPARQIVVRHWSPDKTERARSLHRDLNDGGGAWALVTHASAAANEAVLAGVPVFVTGPCAAAPMGLSQLESIEYPRRPDGRREWAAGLAARQWTLGEIKSGEAWQALKTGTDG